MMRKRIALAVAFALGTMAAGAADARITRIQITSTAPAYGGAAIGAVGPYERVVGVAFGEVSPTSRFNNIIVPWARAGSARQGRVRSSSTSSSRSPRQGNSNKVPSPPTRRQAVRDFNRSTAATTRPLGNRRTTPRTQGYSMVLERLGFRRGQAIRFYDHEIPHPKNRRGADHGPAYEYS